MIGRRHPLVTIILVALVILGLVTFSKSFEASDTLSRIHKVLPAKIDQQAVEESNARQAIINAEANAQLAEEQRHSEYHISADYITNNEVMESPVKDSTPVQVDPVDVAMGTPIMAKMPNQTIRAEVGRAGWKLLHTILSQFPEKPTDEDKTTLSTYLKLLSRVYPCQECAWHFQDLLRKFPPQLSSRKTAVMWGCDAHNKVNKRLGKEIFDCAYIFDKYDCGCGDQEDEYSEKVPGDEGFEEATNKVPIT